MKNVNGRIGTGLKGLNEILLGGLLPQKAYLLRGGPGTGKSSIGYKFLECGLREDKKSLLITLSETKENAISNAASMGIGLKEITILDLSPEEQIYKEARAYDVFPAGEVESAPLIDSIVKAVERINPDRVLLDSVSMLKYLHQDPFQYRNMILSFIRYITNSGATVVMISETAANVEDEKVSYWVDGVINVSYAPEWRKISVSKFRGSDFLSGDHAFKLSKEGPEIFPRIRPSNYERQFQNEILPFGISGMDKLLKGGIEKGTINLISGATGVGKTSLGIQFLKEASLRDERSVIYTFEEASDIIIRRAKGIGIELENIIASEKLRIVSVEPLSYSPDEFINMVRRDIEENDTTTVMIDSIGGYSLSIRDDKPLQRLHTLAVYLQNMGITGILINEVQNISGEFTSTDINASYLADNIIFLRYFEQNGELRKIIGVLKKRLSGFKQTVHEFEINNKGLHVGAPVTKLHGLISTRID